MPAALDHLLIPSKDRRAAARLISEILGVPWSEQSRFGPFSQVFLSGGCTLDFDQWSEPVPKGHYCFRVNDDEFGQILARLRMRKLPYRSTSHGPIDYKTNSVLGGQLLYWDEPDGHVWEVLTVSYERQSEDNAAAGGD
ncbi:MAG: VOC family protein [Geminicoccaceae bacterium]